MKKPKKKKLNWRIELAGWWKPKPSRRSLPTIRAEWRSALKEHKAAWEKRRESDQHFEVFQKIEGKLGKLTDELLTKCRKAEIETLLEIERRVNPWAERVRLIKAEKNLCFAGTDKETKRIWDVLWKAHRRLKDWM